MPTTQNGQTEVVVNNTTFSDIEINDLIGEAPNWILKSGISMMALATIIILAFTIVIRFPDKIQAPALITTENPPIEIVAKVNGKIEKLFVKDRQLMQQGDLIAYIENSAKFEDVQLLIAFFEQFDELENDKAYLSLNFPEAITLGEFQSEATAFEQKLSEFKSFLRQRGTQERILAFQREAQKMEQLSGVFKKERSLLKEELAWNQKDKERFKKLKEQKTVSESEYEKKEVVLIQQQRQLESTDRELIRNEIRIEELRTQQLELAEARQNNIQEYHFALKELRNRIANKIQEWEDRYFLRAEVAGTCNIPVELVENKVVSAGEAICYIVPGAKAGQIIAQAKVSIYGVGKIEKGDRAILRLDPYPFKEFGSVESTVTSVSMMPTIDPNAGRFYTVIVPVGDTIKTDYQKQLPYRPNMNGEIYIITKDKSLFHRIFEQIIRLLKD